MGSIKVLNENSLLHTFDYDILQENKLVVATSSPENLFLLKRLYLDDIFILIRGDIEKVFSI